MFTATRLYASGTEYDDRLHSRVSRRDLLWRAATLAPAVLAGGLFVDTSGSDPRSAKAPRVRGASATTSPPPAPTTTTTTLDPRVTTTLPGYFERGPSTRPLVAVTLDDVFGVDGVTMLQTLLDVLARKNLQMTVFPTGSALQQHLDAGKALVWQNAVADGLIEIGNHTYTHNVGVNPDLTRLSDAQIADELNRTQAVLDRVLGYHYPMRLMRPPGGLGRGNARVIAAVNRLGYSLVGWDIGGDRATPGPDFASAIINRKPTTNGSIVLTHFTTLGLDDYPPLFDNLRSVRGLEPCTVTALFGS